MAHNILYKDPTKILLIAFFLLVLVSCNQPVASTQTNQPLPASTVQSDELVVIPTAAVQPIPIPSRTAPTSTPLPTIAPTPTTLPLSVTPCGVLLPAILAENSVPDAEWEPPFLDDSLLSSDARPAIERFFTHPDDVSLAVYRLGFEGVGFYHNAERAMPLGSVSKLIQLAAYADQVDNGIIDPQQPVTEADLEQYYLPRSDLNSHNRSLAEFSGQSLTLENVVSMMIRFSSNSATDYLHDLLGQMALEQTAIDLGLTEQSAPCSFIGRFLIMGDGNDDNSRETINQLAVDETRYGIDVAARTERYLTDPVYRTEAQQHWQQRRTPAISTQALFVDRLETRGTAQAYAQLMAQILAGEIGSPDTNQQIRDALEWPYTEFPNNQETYSLIGYKNGTFPGMLNSVYYSWPLDSEQPYVLALFYKNLPDDVYRQWRRDLPHDAFAHWLMSDPNALHIMHVWRDAAMGE